MADTPELKRLAFVKSYTLAGRDYVANSKTFAKVKGIYSSSKESSVLKPGLETLESYIHAYGSPLYEKAVQKAPAYLAAVDGKVDGAVTYVQGAYETRVLPSRPVQAALELKSKLAASHPDNVELFKKARDEYFALVESSLETLQAKRVALTDSATQKVKAAIAEARAKAPVEANAVFQKATAAWDKVSAQPQVAATLEAVLPKITLAKEKALSLLHALTASPYYKSLAEPYVLRAEPYVTSAVAYVKPLLAAPKAIAAQ